MDREALGALFQQALERPPEEREAFVHAACGENADLRDELLSLLASYRNAPDFLERIGERVLPAAFSDDGLLRRTVGDRSRPVDDEHLVEIERRTAGRYELLERLGQGGMGVVYKARDPELDRFVALKFLPAEFTADPGARARLRNEARAASALDHPNIATVYEFGAARLVPADPPEGRLFLAMAYYDGEPLDRRVARGPLPVPAATDIARQLAEGLARAHEAGIVHRDIKPANLLLTARGELKILDFGIARVRDHALTRAGAVLGTAAYMSPEQTRGEPLDASADVWAAGIVLHEMIAGSRPFGGTGEALIHAIRHDPPPSLPGLRPELPSWLVSLTSRCLDKNPAGRPRDGAALRAELENAREAGPLRPTRSSGRGWDERPFLVVLPFASLSPDPGDAYFSDGLTEEVISDLAEIRALRVISRTSSLRLKERLLGVGEIARELGVRYVVEGSVRKAGDDLRITARLVDAVADTQIWADRFTGTIADVFAIQGRVARAIARALRLRLSPTEEAALDARPIDDPRAYDWYLRARSEAWRFSSDGLERARSYVRSALEIVGENEALLAMLGRIAAMQVEAGGPISGVERAEEMAERVFQLDPDSPRGWWLRCYIAFVRGRLGAAIEAGENALEQAPDDADTLILLGYVYGHAGANRRAAELLRRGTTVDPLTPLTQGMQGFVPVLEGRFAEAVEPYRRMSQMDPGNPFAAVFYGWALAYDRRTEEAVAVLDEAASRFPGTVFESYARSFAHGLRGRREEAIAAITPEFQAAARHSEMFARELAHCYALAGDRDEAFRWLEREVELGMVNLPYLEEHDWFLDGLREDPRFDAVLERARRTVRELALADAG